MLRFIKCSQPTTEAAKPASGCVPEGLYEDYNRGKPEIHGLQRTAEAAKQDPGCPQEGQSAESISRPLPEGNQPNETVQPPLQLSCNAFPPLQFDTCRRHLDSNYPTCACNLLCRHCRSCYPQHAYRCPATQIQMTEKNSERGGSTGYVALDPLTSS